MRTSSYLSILVALGIVLWQGAPSQAALLLYDGFEYNSGELLAPTNDTLATPNPGQHNVAYNLDWRYAGNQTANNNPPGITGGSLGYPGLAPSTGNSVAYDTSQIASARIEIPGGPYTGVTGTDATIYWSGLMKVTSLGSLTTGLSGILLAHISNTVGPGTLPTAVGGSLKIKADGTGGYFIGTGVNNANAALVFTSTAYQPNDTVFVVGSYTSVAGGANDFVKMWVNPSPATFGAGSPPTETLMGTTVTGATGEPVTSMAAFALRNVNTVGDPDVLFDELRIGESWASVTPTPEAGAFLTMGLVGIFAIGAVRVCRRLGLDVLKA
jgi:hypothetical protein